MVLIVKNEDDSEKQIFYKVVTRLWRKNISTENFLTFSILAAILYTYIIQNYEYDTHDHINKITKYQVICYILVEFRNKLKLNIQIRLYNTLVLPIMLYQNERWTSTKINK